MDTHVHFEERCATLIREVQQAARRVRLAKEIRAFEETLPRIPWWRKRYAVNAGALLIALAGLAAWCVLVLMFAGCAGYHAQLHPERPGIAWVKQ